AGGPLHRQQQAQQGALAGAGMAGDEEELAAPDLEGQLVQPDVAVGVALADVFETDHAPSCRANSALTKASASKGRRSSMPSPTPMKRIGVPNCLARAKITPPLAVPSSLVSARPVSSTAWLNWRVWLIAFCPVPASSTSSTSCGALSSSLPITRRTFFS